MCIAQSASIPDTTFMSADGVVRSARGDYYAAVFAVFTKVFGDEDIVIYAGRLVRGRELTAFSQYSLVFISDFLSDLFSYLNGHECMNALRRFLFLYTF